MILYRIKFYKELKNSSNDTYDIIIFNINKCQAKRPRPPSTHSIATYILTIRIRRQRAKALINLGLTKNFISKKFTRKFDYRKKVLKPYGLLIFNKTSSAYNNKKVIYNLGNIRLQIDDLDELQKFDITYLDF